MLKKEVIIAHLAALPVVLETHLCHDGINDVSGGGVSNSRVDESGDLLSCLRDQE